MKKLNWFLYLKTIVSKNILWIDLYLVYTGELCTFYLGYCRLQYLLLRCNQNPVCIDLSNVKKQFLSGEKFYFFAIKQIMFTLQVKNLKKVLTLLLTGLPSIFGILIVYKEVCFSICIATVNPCLPRKPEKDNKINVHPLEFFDI